jgi:hypothetical protein
MAVLDESANEVKCAPNSSFVIGECLKIFDEVETREEYEQANFVQMWKRDARTVEAARRTGLSMTVSNTMRLYTVVFMEVRSSLP